MTSDDLAMLALSLATLQGLVLGFLLAAGALVFSSLATLASDLERLSVQTVTRTHERYLGLTMSQKALLSGAAKPDPVQKIIVMVLANTSFYHRTLDWDRFERKFCGLTAAVAKAHDLCRKRLDIAVRQASASDDARQVQYFMAAYPGFLTEFKRAYDIYADQAAVAEKFGRRARRLTWPSLLGLGAALIVAWLNLVSSPNLGDLPTLRAAGSLGLLVITGFTLGETALAVRELLGSLVPKYSRSRGSAGE